MKRLVLLTLAMALALCACGKEGGQAHVSGGGEEAAVLETALTALLCADAEAYLSVFPPEVAEDYETQQVYSYFFGAADCKAWLDAGLSSYAEAYGDGVRIDGAITSSEEAAVSSLDDENLDYYTYRRYVTEENTEKLISAVFEYTVKGDKDSEEKTARIYFVKQGGKWYLHPCFTFYSF